MTQFAPVVPLSVASVMKEQGVLGNYHLLLAHDVVAYKEQYAEVYKEVIELPTFSDGKMIILDNSLIELGYPAPVEMMERAAEVVRPNFMVLPDHLGNLERTIKESGEALVKLEHIDTHFIGVIQGATHAEYIECARYYQDELGLGVVSVPRHIVKQQGTRKFVVHEMYNMGLRMHLLGFSDNPLDDVTCARMPGVMGIDSAVPARLATQERHFSIVTKSDPGPRGDWWDNPFGFGFKDEQLPTKLQKELLKVNHTQLRNWLT